MNTPQKKKQDNKLHLFNTSWFDAKGDLDWRQIIWKMVLVAVFFLIVYAIGMYFVRDEYLSIAEWISSHLGWFGVAVFVFLTDMFIVPLSIDMLFPLTFDWPAAPLLLTMSIASSLGGYSGYWIGRLLGKLPFVKQFTSHFSEDGERMINKYGVWAVVIAGVTPVPFSSVCWMAGMVKINYWWVALATLSRFPRMIIYYVIIRGGLSFIV
ncbi:MAG: VTT domain-containing protein [Sphaerochaetaceae bacterium]|jgi:membrane protein YqaA with SNARE-associated domain